jgi:hypothetical protein
MREDPLPPVLPERLVEPGRRSRGSRASGRSASVNPATETAAFATIAADMDLPLLRAAALASILVACGPSDGEQGATVTESSGGEVPAAAQATPPPLPPSSSSTYGPSAASAWADQLTSVVLGAIAGTPPPADVPLSADSPVLLDGSAPGTTLSPAFMYVGATVVLSDGTGARVLVFLTPRGARVGMIEPRPSVRPTGPLPGYFAPAVAVADQVVAEFRAGRGAANVATANELRELLSAPAFLQRAERNLPNRTVIALTEQVARAVAIQSIALEEVGVVLRSPDARFFEAKLRVVGEGEGARFNATPFVSLRPL